MPPTGTPTEELADWSHVDPGQPLPPPGVLDLSLESDAVPGSPLFVKVRNVTPGQTVTITLSTQGEGAGPCPGVLGGRCLDIRAPRLVGSGVAGANGVAQIAVNIPAFVSPGIDLWLQAVVANGANSDSSNVGHAITTTDCPNRPDVSIVDVGLAAGTFNPGGFAVAMVGANEFGLHDFGWDTDGDGIPEEYSGFLEYQIYGPTGQLCSVFFDTDLATSVDPSGLVTDSGGLIYEAWQFQVVGSNIADSYTDCPALDPAVWGTTDIREVLAIDTIVGVGQLSGLRAGLQSAYGADWPLVSPSIYGAYVSLDGATATELSYAFGYEMADCGEYANGAMMPSAVSPPAGLYEVNPYLVFLF